MDEFGAPLTVPSSVGAAPFSANITANVTSPRTALSLSDPASIARFLYANRDMFIMEGRIIGLALSVIYLGAHASLQRPHSAAPRDDDDDDKNKDKDGKKSRRRRRSKSKNIKEGLQLSDAILMPFFTAAALMGLYYLIQYMQDPALLNRIVQGYTSLVAIASVGMLIGDALNLAASVVFPNVWVPASGRTLYRIDALRKLQRSAPVGDGSSPAVWAADVSRQTPFPDMVARWLPSRCVPAAWAVRHLVRETWSVRMAVHGVGDTEVDGFTLNGAIGYLLAGVATYLYNFADVYPSLLNNVLGLGLSYFALQVVSGTSFVISTVVLAGLFVYDIVMVFYTPFMITVATKLEAPIKIVAKSGYRTGMLGLGDIVVPGMFICLCLRYDLYRYYARQIKTVDTTLETEAAAATDDGKSPDGDAALRSTTTAVAARQIKPRYIDPQGRWGDRLWTAFLFRGNATAAARAVVTPGLEAAKFPKPFFNTAMVAYVIGLVLAIGAMITTGKGQPALFYLVPVMLVATWGRAAVTGDLWDVWAYTEDSTLDTKDVVVELGPDGKPVKEAKKEEKKGGGEKDAKESEEAKDDEDGHDVVLFAIRAPPEAELFDVDI